MQTIIVDHNMYETFQNRTFEDVYAYITIQYDIDDIAQNNITDTNFIVDGIMINEDDAEYLEGECVDIDKVKKTIYGNLLEKNDYNTQERMRLCFLSENISEEEYDKIQHLLESDAEEEHECHCGGECHCHDSEEEHECHCGGECHCHDSEEEHECHCGGECHCHDSDEEEEEAKKGLPEYQQYNMAGKKPVTKPILSKEMVVRFDLYALYDRAFEGVMASITLNYDLIHMADNGITKENLKVKNVAFGEDTLEYLSSQPYDIPRIERETMECVSDPSALIELFTENLVDAEYDQIKHLFTKNVVLNGIAKAQRDAVYGKGDEEEKEVVEKPDPEAVTKIRKINAMDFEDLLKDLF